MGTGTVAALRAADGTAPGAGWLGPAVRAAGRLADLGARGRLSVLIFHRVLPAPDPLFPSEVDAARFDRLCSLLAAGFSVLPLARALALQAEGRLPPRAVSITFDDGYADNAEVALPVLARHGLPACFFIASGFLDGSRMWNDTVIETVRASRLDGIGTAGLLDGLADARADRSPALPAHLPLADVAQRRGAVEALLGRIKYLTLGDREVAIERLHRAAGEPELPARLMMVPAQVRELHRAGMEIGAHTVRHPILCVLPDAVAEAEMDDSRHALQAITGTPVTLFAYPNGKPGRDYDARHAAMARRLGFDAAVSTSPGVVTPASDRFQLPRFTPWDAQPWRWAARLLRERARHTPAAVAA